MNRLTLMLPTLMIVGGCTSPDVAEQEAAAASPQSNVTTVTSTDARSGASSATSTSSTDGTGTSVSTSATSNSGDVSSASSSISTSNGGLSLSEDNEHAKFAYSWPSEAGAEPQLYAFLDADLDATREEFKKEAKKARQDAADNGYPYRKHSLEVNWQVVADTPQMLSLNSYISSYTGGAHGNLGFDALVWDKKNSKRMSASDFFASPAAMSAALKPRYCPALNKEREKKRGFAIEADSSDQFDKCPPMKDLDILLGSSNGKAFDRIGLLAAPYVAGPYVEGDYEVTLPVDDAVMKALKPAYRKYFAVR